MQSLQEGYVKAEEFKKLSFRPLRATSVINTSSCGGYSTVRPVGCRLALLPIGISTDGGRPMLKMQRGEWVNESGQAKGRKASLTVALRQPRGLREVTNS